MKLFDLGQHVLDVAVQRFAEAEIALPDRQLVYMTPIPGDCAQVAVLMGTWALNPPLEGPGPCTNSRWYGSFTLVVMRDCPAMPSARGKPPTVDNMERSAKIASDDVEVLTLIAESFPFVDGIEIRIGAPSGGLQRVELDLQIPAEGA